MSAEGRVRERARLGKGNDCSKAQRCGEKLPGQVVPGGVCCRMCG